MHKSGLHEKLPKQLLKQCHGISCAIACSEESVFLGLCLMRWMRRLTAGDHEMPGQLYTFRA